MAERTSKQGKTWAKRLVLVVASLQIIVYAIIMGILFYCGLVIHVTREHSILHRLLVTYYSPLLVGKTSGAEVFVLARAALTSFVGLLTGIVLFVGACRGVIVYLQLWLVYAFVLVNLDLIVHIWIGVPSIILLCRLFVTIAFYCFAAWPVVSYLKELSPSLSFTLPTTVTPSHLYGKGST